VGVKEVRWDKGGTVRAGDCNFFMEKETKIINWNTGFFVHHRIVSAFKIIPKTVFTRNKSRIFCHFPKYHIKILLGDFNAKEGSENIFKPTIGNESLHKDSNDNGLRTVNFATSKSLAVTSKIFSHRNIHKYTRTSADGKTLNRIDHILMDRRWHASILDILGFCGADCDTDHYLVVAKLGKDWQ